MLEIESRLLERQVAVSTEVCRLELYKLYPILFVFMVLIFGMEFNCYIWRLKGILGQKEKLGNVYFKWFPFWRHSLLQFCFVTVQSSGLFQFACHLVAHYWPVVTMCCANLRNRSPASTGTHHSRHDKWHEKLVSSRFNSGVDNHFLQVSQSRNPSPCM
jgi:hypothetical protein